MFSKRRFLVLILYSWFNSLDSPAIGQSYTGLLGRRPEEIMFRRRSKGGGRKRRSTSRTCPFCDTENPLDANSCHQCYYELNKKAKDQSSASSDTSSDSLWGELIREVIPGEGDELVMEVRSMDEMTYEIDEYETVGDDEVIIMSEDGPSFEEILDSAQMGKEDRKDEVLMSLAIPTIAETTAIQEDDIELPTSILESSVPAALIPPSLLSPNLLSEDSLDDDLDEIIAAATVATPVPEPAPPVVVSTPPPLPATPTPPPVQVSTPLPVPPPAPVPVQVSTPLPVPPPAPVPVQVSTPLPVPPPAPIIPSIPPPPAAFQIPTPVVAVPTAVVPVPAIPSLAQVNGAIAPSSPIPTPQVAPLFNGAIWPWPQAELWDQRDLRRGIIEAMELAGRGDAASALATLDRIGPHLGESMEALQHIGVLLHTLGRGEEMRKMVNAAVATYPSDPNVSTAAAALLQS
jgi:ribosomal protein L40E